MPAAMEKPTRYHTRLQRIQYEGVTARRDAEEEARPRWLHVLCGMVSNTDTPMGRLVREKPGSLQLVGVGKRASMLRARTRAIRKYVMWLASAFSVPFTTCTDHVVEYLQVRLSEPSFLGAIKGTHQAMCFFQEVCGVTGADRWTNEFLTD